MMIVEVSSFGPLRTNVIFIGCTQTKKAAVIDPAFQSTPWVLQKAQSLDLEIEKILLTHSHWDHFADAAELKKRTEAELYVHSLDEKNVEMPGSDALSMFIPIPSVLPDHIVTDGDEIHVGHLVFRVIHTPGHSPGGVCYYEKRHRLLISGDTLFKGTIGNLELPTSDVSQMKVSLRKLSSLPKETRVIPGHGDETTIGKELNMLQMLLKED